MIQREVALAIVGTGLGRVLDLRSLVIEIVHVSRDIALLLLIDLAAAHRVEPRAPAVIPRRGATLGATPGLLASNDALRLQVDGILPGTRVFDDPSALGYDLTLLAFMFDLLRASRREQVVEKTIDGRVSLIR